MDKYFLIFLFLFWKREVYIQYYSTVVEFCDKYLSNKV